MIRRTLTHAVAAAPCGLLAAALLLVVSAGLPAQARAATPEPPRFIDLAERIWPGQPVDDNPFHDLHYWLMYEFEDICRDFFCEGAYDNYHPLRLTCVVDRVADSIQACRFSVAASMDRIDPVHGTLVTAVRHWECPLPLPAGLPVPAFHAATDWQDGSSGRLFNPLPGSGQSMFDVLRDCLP